MDRQKGITGIYKITNLINNKFYIGQSRNIYRRWKQHTSKLPEEQPTSRIRAAFQKYGLNHQIVRQPGIYGNFKFEILELCEEIDLLKRETEIISNLKPEYNCSILTSGKFYKGNYKRQEKRFWIQYHNYDAEKGYPSQDILDDYNENKLEDSHHYISTRKRGILYSQGDTVFLILGKTINRVKNYYLWTKTIVEEVDFLEDEDLIYNAIGEQNFIYPPHFLNDKEGFANFRKKAGNFGLGFQNISSWDFLKTLKDISEKYECTKENSLTYKQYIDEYMSNTP